MSSFYITCGQGLSSFVVDELQALGIESTLEATGVRFEGELKEAYQALLWTRCGSRVLLQLKTGKMKDLDDLYNDLFVFPWSTHMDHDDTLAIHVTTRKAPQIHTQYASQRAKDAIIDYFKQTMGVRPNVDKTDPDFRFYIHILENSYTLYLDLSGEPLHKRGFRTEQGVAPIKENLAAALLYRSKWPEKAKEHQDFIDPLCGAGTILIEAALMARDIAPGLFRREFGFTKWRGHNEHTWNECVKIAKHRAVVGEDYYQGKLYGVERNARMIGITKANADRANVLKNMQFSHQFFQNFRKPENLSAKGLIVTNPPYGERLGDKEELMTTYAELGDWLRKYEGFEAGVITSDVALGKTMGLRARKVNKFYNGALECHYLQFVIDASFFVDRTRADERKQHHDLSQALSEGGEDFKNRLLKNRKKWERWAKHDNISCYRVYDADLPEFNVAIDLYEQSMVIYEYAPPKTIDAQKAATRIEKVAALVPNVYPEIDPDNIHLKVRERQRGKSQYERSDEIDGKFFEVHEDNARLWVNLTNYLDTGLFLDHRLVRKMIFENAKDKRFLNLFAYTGTASVHAANGGAAQTVTIDLSRTYLQWAKNNFELNGHDINSNKHQFIHADVIEWLEFNSNKINALPPSSQQNERYDLIFMDPPSFSNSKRMEGVLDIQVDHIAFIDQAMMLLKADGMLIFSTNFRRFILDSALNERYKISDISRKTLPEDFARNPRIRQCFTIEHLDL